MRLFTFIRFMRQIMRKSPADLDWIQNQGLLAVKLAQIFALRSDLLTDEKCQQLQSLYQHAAKIPVEDVLANIEANAPAGFLDAFESIENEPLAAASIGQVHRGRLKTGEEVVVKVVKEKSSKKFKSDVDRMRRWLRVTMFFMPKLRRVGNPVALLNHVADYTTRELDLRNEIIGAGELAAIKNSLSSDFSMPKLRFPKYWANLSNENVLVSEFIQGKSLEQGMEEGSLSWETLLELFRIHGAYMFGIGTFHGDLHPGNCIIDDDGNFVFIDNGAICHAPRKISLALFNFFDFLSKGDRESAYDALMHMSDAELHPSRARAFHKRMSEIYADFESKPVGDQSLTQIMMKTVRAAVELAKADFGEEGFPIIRALMYMDGLVIRTHPDVKLIESMGPYLEEFRIGLKLPTNISSRVKTSPYNQKRGNSPHVC